MGDQFCSAWILLISTPLVVWSIRSGLHCFYVEGRVPGLGPAFLIKVSIKGFWNGGTRYLAYEFTGLVHRWADQVCLG